MANTFAPPWKIDTPATIWTGHAYLKGVTFYSTAAGDKAIIQDAAGNPIVTLIGAGNVSNPVGYGRINGHPPFNGLKVAQLDSGYLLFDVE